MRRKTLLITLLIFILSAVPVFASDYDTEFFGTTVKVSEDNSYDIEEIIRVDFKSPHHGIFRYIPIKGIRLSDIDVPGHEYTEYKENSNEVIRIGSSSKTITGEHSYIIKYKISMWADEDNSKDMLLVNVLPTDWETPVKEFISVIEMPKDTDLSSVKVYSGPYGAETNKCDIKINTEKNTIALRGYDIPANNGVTLVMDLPDGYWNAPQYGATDSGLYMSIIAPLLAFFAWLKRKEQVVVTPEFYPPDEMTPGELGYYCDEFADDKDLFATIVYLASQGYLEIREEKDGLIFEELNFPPDTEPRYVRTLYKGIFSKIKPLKGVQKHTVRSRNFGATFSKQFSIAKMELTNMFIGEKSIYNSTAQYTQSMLLGASLLPSLLLSLWALSYGHEQFPIALYAFIGTVIALKLTSKGKNINSSKVLRYMAVLVIGAAALLMVFGCSFIDHRNWIAVLVWAVSTLATMFFAAGINTRQDVRLYGRILGFKDFIETAELDKLNTLINEDPKYFFNIIPYAYAFGLTNEWIKKFEAINTKMPEIHMDIDTTKRIMTDYTLNMDRGLNYSRRRANEEAARHQEYIDSNYKDISSYIREHDSHHTSSHHDSWSSGGGFSGGGFSGGGSGGGGGGAW